MARLPRTPKPAAAPGDDPKPAGAAVALGPRFSCPITPDKKKFAFDKFQDKTRDQLRELLTDPAVAAELGVASPAVLAAADATPPELCDVVWDVCSMVLIAWARKQEYSPAQAQVLAFTAEEKAKLNPSTAKLFDRYLPGGFGKYQDEMALGLTLVAIVSGKLALLKKSPPATVAGRPTLVQTPAAPPSSGTQESDTSAFVNS